MSLPNLPEVVSPPKPSSPLRNVLPNDNDHYVQILRHNGQGPVRRITKSDSNISDKVLEPSSWFGNENLAEVHAKGTNLSLTDELSGTDSDETANEELPSFEMNVLSYGEGNLDSWTIDIVL
ncbi:hypothetical protein TCAL_17081 [Tigriopus californicus]|uniref:Uncharacterized protein n=1 Tax=Tigriopus californicus TaxID=6832 RepID=A0A553PP90_TIGCA|nr:hypothetical protein TCAL_17081 [Tigriopus californicus]